MVGRACCSMAARRDMICSAMWCVAPVLLASRNASMAAVPLDGCAPTWTKVSPATLKIAHLRTIGIVPTSATDAALRCV